MQPIIIPVTKTVNCIMQDGIRYCENHPMSVQQLEILALSLAGLIIWFAFVMFIADRLEQKYYFNPSLIIIGIGFVLPLLLLIIGLSFIF